MERERRGISIDIFFTVNIQILCHTIIIQNTFLSHSMRRKSFLNQGTLENILLKQICFQINF